MKNLLKIFSKEVLTFLIGLLFIIIGMGCAAIIVCGYFLIAAIATSMGWKAIVCFLGGLAAICAFFYLVYKIGSIVKSFLIKK